MLSLWNPLLPDNTLADSKISSKNYLDRLFYDSFDTMVNDLFKPINMGIEYQKTTNGVKILVDVPGIKEENLTVELSKDNILTIKGVRKTSNSEYNLNKSFSIRGYDPDTLSAELADGVLSLTLKTAAKTDLIKKIEITKK
jgi:HSP20 family molecular chaperone IbpA